MNNFIVKFKFIVKCFYLSMLDLIDHDGIEHAGYLAFMILFSLFPFLIFFTAIISTFSDLLNQYSVVKDFMVIAINNMPNSIISDLLPRINEIISNPPHSLLKLAVIGMIWTSSSTVEAIRTILNKASRVSKSPPYVMRRLLSVLQFLVITFIVLSTIFVVAMIPMIFHVFDKEWIYLRYIASELILFISITWLYFMVPNVKQKLKDVFPGSILVVFLCSLSAVIFTKYIKTFHQFNIIYGSLAGMILSLLFFYIISLFFIYGAELNYRLKYETLSISN